MIFGDIVWPALPSANIVHYHNKQSITANCKATLMIFPIF